MRSAARKSSYLSSAFHVLFFLSGVAAVLIGQVLPILGRRFVLDDLHLGYFFQAQFAGSLIGTFISGWFGHRGRLVDSAWLGGAMMAVGIFAMNANSYGLVLPAFLLNGIGIGMTLPSINLIVLELNPSRSAAALSVLNFFWGVGAIVCKPFVDLTAGEIRITLTTAIVSATLLFLAVIVFVFRPPAVETIVDRSPETEFPEVPIWTTSVAWAIAAFNFIHVGFESGMGGWLTTYAARLEGSEHVGIFSPTFLFFLCFVVGRAIAPVFFRFLDENKMLLASLVTILIGMTVAITAKDITTLGIGSSIAGLGTSSVFPTNVSRFYRIFGSEAMRRATPLFICGTLGGAAATYTIGFVSNHFASLRSGMFVLLFNIAALIVLQSVLTIKTARPQLRDGS